MQSFPLTGSPHDAVYATVAPESDPAAGRSADQLAYAAQVERSQAQARQDPTLNGQDAMRRLRS